MPRTPRYAAGRARALGLATRGTTAPQRLRRVDRWLCAVHAGLLRGADPAPLVVDLGYGASPVTAVELHRRVREVRPDAEVLGLEIDPERVAAALPAEAPGLRFARGGFELAGLPARGRAPLVVRALNVLRQYDEVGRRAAWLAGGRDGPHTLVLAAHLPTLDRPGSLAERLPKALIHHNVPGRPVHALLRALDDAWDRAATPYGPRARWVTTCDTLDWPGADARRARLGELSVPWSTVAPDGAAL